MWEETGSSHGLTWRDLRPQPKRSLQESVATACEAKQEEATLLPSTCQATASAELAGAAAKEVKYREPTIAEGLAIISEYAQPVKGGRF